MKKLTIFLIGFLLLSHIATFAQSNVLQLNFTAEYYGQYVPTDSIYIENLTQGGDTMLYYPDTAMVLEYIIGINNPVSETDGFRVLQNLPNPFSEQTEITVMIPEADEVEVTVSNIAGQKIASMRRVLTAGKHSFLFYPGAGHYYVLSAIFQGTTRAIKMVSMNVQSHKSCELLFVGSEQIPLELKSAHEVKGFPFTIGDQLRFVGYSENSSGIIASDVIEDAPEGDEDYVFEIIEGIPCAGILSLTYEGQTYTTVQIANQCWLKENLNVGTMINTSGNQTNNGTIEKYCYDDDAANCEIYGGLYQWDEMMQYTTQQGAQGICPPDWHLPKDSEITALTDYLGGEEVACGKMKETGEWHWSAPNTGATNSSGFTAFAGGYYDPDMGFSWPSLTFYGSYWSSTESDTDNAWERDLGYEEENIWRIEFLKTAGLSARCIKDQMNVPVVTTAGITDITQTSAIGGGEVTDDGGSEVTARGVCWSTSQNPTIADIHTLDGTGTGTFISNLTGLSPNTPYFVRAYATNSVGTAYGDEISFTTQSAVFTCGSNITINHVAGDVAPVTKTVTYGTVTNIPGEPTKCWITSNLGSDHQATSLTDATEASAGWYWQFNRKQGYKHTGTIRTPNTPWINIINENSNWLPVNDPCNLMLGNGWRIPTNAEWTNVDAVGNWTNWYGPWNSALKMHAAGFLWSSDGSLDDRGGSGNYYSTTQNSIIFEAWRLQFLSVYSQVGNTSKAMGNTLRCIRD